MRTKLPRSRSVFLLLVVTVGAGLDAEAGWRRQSGHFCMPYAEYNWYQSIPGSGLVSTGSGNNSFRCPLFDDSHIARNTIAGVNVHVAGSGYRQASAQACIQYAGVDGVACGPTATATLNGAATLTPSTVQWSSLPNDWAFLDLSLCQNCGVFGYFTYTN